ncbi:MAG: hypothetical protein ACTHZ9_13070, partial [Leucobacter sp.]
PRPNHALSTGPIKETRPSGAEGGSGTPGLEGSAASPGAAGLDDPDEQHFTDRDRLLFNADWAENPIGPEGERFFSVLCGLSFAEYSETLQRVGIEFPFLEGHDLVGWAPRTGPLPEHLGETVPVDTVLSCDTSPEPMLAWVAMWEPIPEPDPEPTPEPNPTPAPAPTPPERVDTAAKSDW